MAQLDTQVKTVLLLDGKQPAEVLKELDTRSKQLANDLEKAIAAGDKKEVEKLYKEFTKVNKETEQIKKNTFDLEKVVKNLNGSSLKDLNRAYKELQNTISNTADRESKQYKDNIANLRAVENEIKKVKTEMRGTTGKESEGNFLTNMFGVAGGIGIANIAGRGLDFVRNNFMNFVNSTTASADKFEAVIGGVNEATQEFFSSIMNGDWSNLLDNMTLAYEIGVKYTETLDDITDRSDALKVIHAKNNVEIARLTIVYKNANLSLEERIEALNKLLELEKENAEANNKTAWDTANNEQDRLSGLTKLTGAQLQWYNTVLANNEEVVKKGNEIISAEKTLAKLQETKTLYIGQYASKIQAGSKKEIEDQKQIIELLKKNAQARDFAIIKQQIESKRGGEYFKKYQEALIELENSRAAYDENTTKSQTKRSQFEKELAEEEKKRAEEKLKINEKIRQSEENLSKIYKKIADDQKKNREEMRLADEKYYEGLAKMTNDAIQKQEEKTDQSFKDIDQAMQNKYRILGELLPEYIERNRDLEVEAMKESLEYSFMSEEEKQLVLQKIKEKYDKKQKDLEKQSFEEKIAYYEQYVAQAQKLLDAFSTYQQAKMNQELSAAGDNEAKKEQIRKKYAERQKDIDIAQAIINTLVGITKAIAQGGILGIITGAVVAASGYAQVEAIRAQQFATGNVDVIGADDGRKYNAMYSGTAKGVTTTKGPSLYLAGEAGPEMIVDAQRTRNMQLNYPWLIDAIRNVPQYANGNVSNITTNNYTTSSSDPELKMLLRSLNQKMDEGIPAKVVLSQFERVKSKRDATIAKMKQ